MRKRRNYAEGTTRSYVRAVQQFAQYFGKSPDKLGPSELRSYQAYLLKERKLAVGTVVARVAALRFFFGAHVKAAPVPGRSALSQKTTSPTDGAEFGRGRPAYQ